MAYTKTNWVNGGPPAISAENLNKIEQGIYDLDQIKSGLLVVEHYTYTYGDVSSGSAMSWDQQKTKAGFYPIGVVGFRTGRQTLLPNRCNIYDPASGSCSINMNARAIAATAGATAYMDVLWVKE